MERIAERILRLPASADPLSSDVFIVEGDKRCYVFDVGACDEAYHVIRAIEKPVVIILSHFHRDHTENMARLEDIPEVLGGARTLKTIGRGTLVERPLLIRDGVTLLVQPCVSPHAPGCLIATVDEQYTLIGDLPYAQSGMGQGEAVGMLRELKRLGARYLIPSHREGCPLLEKEAALEAWKAHFNAAGR